MLCNEVSKDERKGVGLILDLDRAVCRGDGDSSGASIEGGMRLATEVG